MKKWQIYCILYCQFYSLTDKSNRLQFGGRHILTQKTCLHFGVLPKNLFLHSRSTHVTLWLKETLLINYTRQFPNHGRDRCCPLRRRRVRTFSRAAEARAQLSPAGGAVGRAAFASALRRVWRAQHGQRLSLDHQQTRKMHLTSSSWHQGHLIQPRGTGDGGNIFIKKNCFLTF